MIHHERLKPPTSDYPPNEWSVVERSFRPEFMAQMETILALGNGYLGMRGGPDEGTPTVLNGTFVNGFYEIWPIVYGELAYGFAKTGQTILNVTDSKIINLFVDDEPFELGASEVRHYARLLLKGNPNVLGMLWSDHANLYQHPLWPEWVGVRDAFLTQRVWSAFCGYAQGQLRRLHHPNTAGYMGARRKEQFAQFGYSVKNAAHCIRLLRMALELMETGVMNVDRSDIDADELRAIKRGEWSLRQVDEATTLLFERLAAHRDTLPPDPDMARIDRLVMETVQWAVTQ